MKVDDIDASRKAAKELGLEVSGNVVSNQDGYDFDTKLLGMTPDPYFDTDVVPNLKGRKHKVLSYPAFPDNADPTAFVLVQADEPLNLQEWEGRNALTFPSEHVKAIYEAVQAYDPTRIVHSLEE